MDHICHPDGSLKLSTFFSVSLFFSFFVLFTLKMTGTGIYELPTMSCEDWPCCGHEWGCCPDYDREGRQMNMRCLCGARLSINAQGSLCDVCLNEDSPIDEGFECCNCEHEGDCEGAFPGDEDCLLDATSERFHNTGSEVPWELSYWRARALKAEQQIP